MPAPFYPGPKYTDGDYSKAVPVSLPQFSSSIPGVTDEVQFTQRWRVFRNAIDEGINGLPLALNTPHPNYTNFFLVEESEKQDLGAGMVESTRTYAKVPTSHFDPISISYSFIGLTIALQGGGSQVRNRQNKTVQGRIRYDYFIANGTPQADPLLGGAPVIVNSDGDIPFVLDQQYVSQGQINGATYGGILLPVDFLNLAGTVLPTWPTADDYKNKYIADAIKNKWGATLAITKVFTDQNLSGTPPTSGHDWGTVDTANSIQGGILVAEPSVVNRWRGLIYQRATRLVLAQ